MDSVTDFCAESALPFLTPALLVDLVDGYGVPRLAAALRVAHKEHGHRVVDLQAGRAARERGVSARPHRLPANGPAS